MLVIIAFVIALLAAIVSLLTARNIRRLEQIEKEDSSC